MSTSASASPKDRSNLRDEMRGLRPSIRGFARLCAALRGFDERSESPSVSGSPLPLVMIDFNYSVCGPSNACLAARLDSRGGLVFPLLFFLLLVSSSTSCFLSLSTPLWPLPQRGKYRLMLSNAENVFLESDLVLNVRTPNAKTMTSGSPFPQHHPSKLDLPASPILLIPMGISPPTPTPPNPDPDPYI